MRKPSPISTSWPRLTSTSPPRAVAHRASSTAAALLFTTRASFAPVTVHNTSRTWSCREERSPRARLYSRSVYDEAAMVTARTASSGSRARPRLVCTTTPVALMTRRSDGETAAASRRAAQGTMAAAVTAPPSSSPPSRISRRKRSSTARTASTTS